MNGSVLLFMKEVTYLESGHDMNLASSVLLVSDFHDCMSSTIV